MKSFPRAALLGVLALGLLTGFASPRARAQTMPGHTTNATTHFYLRDGDRVVFYGDSITDQRLYTTYIESYCVSRFPKKHFTFTHSGWGGDRVTGGGGGPVDLRLDRDLFAYHPTVVTICLGMNDGSYRAFDQNIFNTYIQGYRHILDRIIKEIPGVRITLVTASAYDDVTRAPGFTGGYNATLTAYGEAIKSLGREYGLTVADTNAPLVAMLARAEVADPTLAPLIIKDRVHPGSGGHVVMAAAVLKAWNAPDTVADIEIDGSNNTVTRSLGSRVAMRGSTNGSISFTHTDSALPWPLDRDAGNNKDTLLVLGTTDIEQTLNRYQLKITNLPAANYALSVDGANMGTVSRDALQQGVDLATMPALAPNKQANSLLGMVRHHNDLHFQRWRVLQVPNSSGGKQITPDIQTKMADVDRQEMQTLASITASAQPAPHRVELTPMP